ncbi:MAG: DUF4399 domain-containing protein [Pseudomonadota bacterium]
MKAVSKSFFILMFVVLPVAANAADRNPSTENAEVFIAAPKDGEALSNPVIVQFGIKNMEVAKAGTQAPNTGHHHLLIDTGLPPLDQPIPKDANHMHFGGGQTEASLTLAPGKHTLQLLLGDGNHIPHHPAVASKVITITVR